MFDINYTSVLFLNKIQQPSAFSFEMKWWGIGWLSPSWNYVITQDRSLDSILAPRRASPPLSGDLVTMLTLAEPRGMEGKGSLCSVLCTLQNAQWNTHCHGDWFQLWLKQSQLEYFPGVFGQSEEEKLSLFLQGFVKLIKCELGLLKATESAWWRQKPIILGLSMKPECPWIFQFCKLIDFPFFC